MKTSAESGNRPAGVTCWNCGGPVSNDHFCPKCAHIQPPAPGEDYFSFLGLGKKLAFDESDLETRFLELSWKLHPDNFAGAGEYERKISLELSSQLNDAYRALRDPISRVEYLLSQAGLRKEGQQKQQAPPELLEEVFELNESLDELRAARRSGEAAEMAALRGKLKSARENFASKLREVDENLQQLFTEWDRVVEAGAGSAPGLAKSDDTASGKLMERMNQALNRRSYIRNLVESVEHELAEG